MYCWRCGYKRYEYTNLKKLIEDRARCFYCLIDVLDKKYGPSMLAVMNKNKDGTYRQPMPTKWETLKPKRQLKRLVRLTENTKDRIKSHDNS